MKATPCRLYEEELVVNIMITTALDILSHTKINRMDDGDVCDYVINNSQQIIKKTIDDLNEIST